MVLAATIAQYPGVGCLKIHDLSEKEQKCAIGEVQDHMHQVALDRGVSLSKYSIPTLRKDLECLKRYGILENRRYRWGYYLGSGVMSWTDLQVALNILESQANYQHDPTASRVYRTISQRIRGAKQQEELLYPVRVNLNSPVNEISSDDLISKSCYHHTLFHELETVEQSILKGQALQLCRKRTLHESIGRENKTVYPLQVIHYNAVPYLLYEHCEDGYLSIDRIDRFDDNCKIIDTQQRSLKAQRKSLDEAHKLLKAGWGLYLGQPDEQKLEREGKLELVAVTARFFGTAVPFILEGDRRHPTQEIRQGSLPNGGGTYLDYTVTLPPRAFTEFGYWLLQYTGKVRVMSPPELVEQHRQLIQQAADLYAQDFS